MALTVKVDPATVGPPVLKADLFYSQLSFVPGSYNPGDSFTFTAIRN